MREPPTTDELTGLLVAGPGGYDPTVGTVVAGRLVPLCSVVYAGPGVLARGTTALRVTAPHAPVLAVIVAALERAPTPLVAVVSADLPRANPSVLAALAHRWRGGAAVVPVVDGRVRPFHGVYATAAAGRLREVLEGGTRSVIHALSTLGANVVGEEAWGDIDGEGSFVEPAQGGRTAPRPVRDVRGGGHRPAGSA